MEKFKISDIQELFVADVERFHNVTQQAVRELLEAGTPLGETLEEALRQCHTLKGLAGSVEAWGLSCLGADFECLLQLAGSWLEGERERANEVFEFILEHMQDWFVMNQFSCMEMLPQAWDIYQGLRTLMEDRWPGCLPEIATVAGPETVAGQYVRLQNLELTEVAPDPAAAATAAEAVSATELTPTELDVPGAAPVAGAADSPIGEVTQAQHESQSTDAVELSRAPLPVRVVPPALRQREQTAKPIPAEGHSTLPTADGASTEAAALAGESVGPVEQPASPKPLQVVPPALRRRQGAEVTKTEPARAEAATAAASGESTNSITPATIVPTEQTELPPKAATENLSTGAASATPPILRVAPPALKRRGKKSGTPAMAETSPAQLAEAASTVAPAAAEALSVPPLAVEPAAAAQSESAAAPTESAEALSAEALFASLPEVEEKVAARSEGLEVASSEELAPSSSAGELESGAVADGELLGMLSQELAGYLRELSAALLELAQDLSAAEPWGQVRRLFHTIKGTAATFGLDAVSGPAKAAEGRCLAVVEAVHRAAPSTESELADLRDRTREVYEECVHRAGVVARGLNLAFDEGVLREALERGLAEAANLAVLRAAAAEVAPAAGLDPEMAGFFINDTRDQIAVIEQAVLRWERLAAGESGQGAGGKSGGQCEQWVECVQAAQRGFHTIKGAGNSIGLGAVAASVHEVESFLEGLVAGSQKSGDSSSSLLTSKSSLKPVFTFLLGAVDQLRGYLSDLSRNTATVWRHDWSGALQLLNSAAAEGAAEAEPVVPVATASVAAALSVDASEDAQTLRIETARLHQLLNLIGELVVDRARLARKIEQLAGLHRALAERNGALTGSVLTFQQQFEFSLVQPAAAGRAGNADRGLNMEDGTKGPLAFSTIHAPASTAGGHGEFSELEFDRYDQFNVLARSLVEVCHDIDQLNAEVGACLEGFAADSAQFALTSRELQGRVSGLSLVPVKVLWPRLQRAFRDACGVEGKVADLICSGGEALLDKGVVDRVYGPLLHLIRNAVAHGVEDAATRARLNKPARGLVRLSAAQVSNQVVLELSDDGAGVDVTAVRARAIEKGWLKEGDKGQVSSDTSAGVMSPDTGHVSPELSVEQVVDFIFRPGFSTASKVSSVAGRGIGLDVVRQVVENLNGSVELKWVAGQGTTWSLRLPLTLSVSEAVLAGVGKVVYAFPLCFVEAGLILEERTRVSAAGVELYPVMRREGLAERIERQGAEGSTSSVQRSTPNVQGATANGPASGSLETGANLAEGSAVNLQLSQLLPVDASEQTRVAEVDWLPVLRLSRMFGLGGEELSNKGLIVGVGERRAIVVVDEVLARQEVVVKELDGVLGLHPLLNGASLDAEGRVVPILNLPTLLKYGELVRGGAVGGGVRLEGVARVEQTRVLVVDDSLSVRKVQERFFRDLGCVVVAARDGLEGLERLREGAGSARGGRPFDFIFTDLEMPRLNGYELISEVRGNPAWSGIPVVVVSSRGADKYITKAMNLGASTFLTKPFTQEQLRAVLEHFAGREG